MEAIIWAEDIHSASLLFSDGDVVGQLDADDAGDEDSLTFGGSNAFLGVTPATGEIVITDGAGLNGILREQRIADTPP